MIVPQYWAEGRIQQRKDGKQITVRRFGWSDVSQEEAQAHADQRTAEAFQRISSGEKLERREPKLAYHGAQGIPIREEIVDRRGETIITRNSYGARCLNTPNVLFADIDFEDLRPGGGLGIFAVSRFLLILLLAVALVAGPAGLTVWTGILAAILLFVVWKSVSEARQRLMQVDKRVPEEIARDLIAAFIAERPEWNLRIYSTPAGLRVLATHRTFGPDDPAVAECFEALGTDRVYRLMCRNQQCFRARVSPKPWRIGIDKHMKPRTAVWPISPEKIPGRKAWVERYESSALSFASCRLIENKGSGTVHPDVVPVMIWHDELSRAESGLPIA
ncbi:MAG: hypothetical protein EOP85_02565 [Verrucomicrobiaceae bacterium]|nr:MAG: hypothetical protein EOP85_02565 [Verrucomicrobiaceae bacterium]